ncbi:MAG TPA: DUF4142 domain-containing protein [Mucilaginibacter sp.]|nr:DUF4142 domain-containing protein [Mucilaginibacter sp.]
MKKLIYLAAGIIFLFSSQACRDKKGKNYNKTQDDQQSVLFIRNGIESGLTEIKASGLAITNSGNQKVIGLAKTMIDDHTRIINKLKQLETDKKMPDADTLSSVHQQMIAQLSKLKGPAFDKLYLQMMVNSHQQALKLYTNAENNSDSRIRKVAANNISAIKMHLDSANAICVNLQ